MRAKAGLAKPKSFARIPEVESKTPLSGIRLLCCTTFALRFDN